MFVKILREKGKIGQSVDKEDTVTLDLKDGSELAYQSKAEEE